MCIRISGSELFRPLSICTNATIHGTGVDEPDSGAVRKRNTTVGYLPQQPELDEGLSAIDAILHSGSILARCVLAYEQAIVSGNEKVNQISAAAAVMLFASSGPQCNGL